MHFYPFSLLLLYSALLHLSSALPVTATNWTSTQWDFIVVGAGPAGLIMADRLSETGKKTLLLEAGGPSYGITGGTQRPDWLEGTNLSRVDVPGLYKSIFSDGGNLTCGASVNAYGGCTIGGSSAINAGLFFQPPTSDFDLYFPKGWKRKDVSSAIKRLKQRQPSVGITSTDGRRYLQSGYHAARRWLVDGAGYAEVQINAKADDKIKVFGHPIFDYINGQRAGPVVTYLQTSLERSNFLLRSGVRVQRILRNGAQATGVEAIVNDVSTIIPLSSCGRVIVSGGAIQSPQLLMFSGIGDPSILSRLSAANQLDPFLRPESWINNTAVGAGLFDNPNTFIELSSPSVESYTYSYDSPVPSHAAASAHNRTGPYTFASETSVFWDTITHSDGSVVGLQGTIDSSGYGDYTSNNTITLNVYGTSGLLSSGRVILSNETFAAGPSDDVYYSNPRDASDIATFIHSIFAALASTSPPTLTPLNIPANASHADIVSYITTPSAYARGMVNHWSSSCRFGACVDADAALVLGMRNLHVVDASVVPPLTVNPQMGIMIVAERAAELIKGLI